MTQPKMLKSTKVKICGLSTPETMTAALEGGADFVGLVFHPASPRYVEIEVAAYLASFVPETVKVVGLFADPTDSQLEQTLYAVRLDMIQLHGQETPQRVAEIHQKFGKPIMKAIGIRSADDLALASTYDAVDWFLFDAPPASLPGGTGKTFDWSVLDGYKSSKPWMLAGGLTPENVGEAISRLHPPCVDVSSGVESSRGVKDPDKIRAFIRATKGT